MSPSIFVFTALNCEAKPLIRSWRLKKHSHNQPFAIYSDAERVVVVTGIGKIAMAGAVGYTLSLFPNIRHPLLLNIGIAGNRRHSLGSLYLADKIVDANTGKKFYPQLPFAIACETAAVATLATPHAGYAEDCLYDMEASAFYEMACKFSSSELIHSLKIVSDNAESPLENITESLVEEWCIRQIDAIDTLIARLHTLRQSLPVTDLGLYWQLLGEFHFTSTSAVKLAALSAQWHLLMGEQIPAWRDANPRSGKALILWLEKQLEMSEFYL